MPTRIPGTASETSVDREALRLATRLLVSGAEGCRASSAAAVSRELFRRIPCARGVDLAVRDRRVTGTCGEPAEEGRNERTVPGAARTCRLLLRY